MRKKHLLPKLLLCAMIWGIFNPIAFSQNDTKAQKIEQTVQRIKKSKKVENVIMSEERATPLMISFKKDEGKNYQFKDAKEVIEEYLNVEKNISKFKFHKEIKLANGFKTHRFEQYYKGIKVEHGDYIALSNPSEVLTSINGEYYEAKDINTTPTLSLEEAIEAAKDFVGAESYGWDYVMESYNGVIAPDRMSAWYKKWDNLYGYQSELVIVNDYETAEEDLDLAYKLNVYAFGPMSRDWIFINAHTGKVMLKNPIIKHAHHDPGTATVMTRYIGERIIHTSAWDISVDPKEPNPLSDADLDLMDSRNAGACVPGAQADNIPYLESSEVYLLINRVSGAATNTTIETYDANGQGGAVPLALQPDVFNLARSLTDDDNIWTDEEHVRNGRDNTVAQMRKCNDDIMWDAHWGATTVFEYWGNEHARNSYDGNGANIYSVTHIGTQYDNAFWNGTAMCYGDGDNFLPLTALDVCAHEIGHAVCETTSDLVYASQSGAMNEGFSDIWAAATDFYAINEIDANLGFDGSNNGLRPFGIGEQIDADDKDALRFMDSPKLKGDPDTKGGLNYIETEGCVPASVANDQCGVHTNSGVLNKWYYLMAVGSGTGSGPNEEYAGTNTGVFDHTDDEINDHGDIYSVTGLGFVIADRIAFGTEVLLTANATFDEARTATIQFSSNIYGPCSHETKQATNAWYAVGVGAEFVEPCEAASIGVGFVEAANKANETAEGATCDATNDVKIKVFTNTMISQDVIVDAASTAIEGKDFIINNKTVTGTMSGYEAKDLIVSIIDDAVIEGDETIVLKFPANSDPQNDTYTLTISSDDVAPSIGKGTPITIYGEDFETPRGNDSEHVSVIDHHFGFTLKDYVKMGTLEHRWLRGLTNGAMTNQIGAILDLVTPVNTFQPQYDANGNNDLVAYTPKIDARGLKDINVSFAWGAGGETNTDLANTIYDYGSIVFNLDDALEAKDMLNPGDFFVGEGSGVTNPRMDQLFSKEYSNLDNKEFYLGLRWLNDADTGGPVSFAVDDIVVTGVPRKIESDLEHSVATVVDENEDIYFFSGEDGDVVARLQNAAGSLGCVSTSISEAGSGTATFMEGIRTQKVVQIDSDNDANYTLTLYYTKAEVDGTGVAAADLNIIKVDGDFSNPTNIQSDLNPIVEVINDPGDGAIVGYSYTTSIFSGFSSFALSDVEPALAIDLLNFDAKANQKDISLDWTTNAEIEHKGFELQRQAEGEQEFTAIAWVDGNGTTTNISKYTYVDTKVKANINYAYRLKIVDTNQQFTYSDIKIATLKGDNSITIAPNPATDYINISLFDVEKVKDISLLDVTGKVLKVVNTQLDNQVLELDISIYPVGIYFVRVDTGNDIVIEKIVKQ